MTQHSQRAAIYDLSEAYISALRNDDLEGWLDTLSNDCVFLPPGYPAMNGKEAIRTWAKESTFDLYRTKLDLDFEEIEFVGSWAFAWGRFHQVLTPKAGGEPVEMKGKFLDVFRREESGRWALARAAFNLDEV
jgi:uncharacterized protein (TIGR02246 family)